MFRCSLMNPELTLKTTAVILNWNCHEMTAECIRSLLAMDAQNLEILLVDNGSSDGSAEILSRAFPQITVLPQERNLGFAAGCNVGMRHALANDAAYVLLLNNDTFVASDFIREMLAAIESDPRIGAVCPKIFFTDRPNLLWYAGADFSPWTGTSKHRGWKEVDQGQFDDYREITQATGCAMLVGATSVKSMGAGSQAIRQFFSTRNMVLVARKHLRWWQIPSYMLGFGITHILLYTALRLWRCDFPALLAIYKGLAQGLRAPLIETAQ